MNEACDLYTKKAAPPRIILAATKSGSGKTLITCALLKSLKEQGLKVSAFKCGPDYIDPMFHERVLGVPSRNLDLYFTNEDETKALFLVDNDSDISVIEGVMGLYDGLGGISEEASAYHLAKTLQAPIVLIVNAHGMGRSILAEIGGFLAMDTLGLIQGVILNQVSESFYNSIAPLIKQVLHIAVYGFFPTKKDLQLDSRYLGLKLPGEIADLQEKVSAAATVLEQSVKVNQILAMAKGQAKEIQVEGCYEWLNPSSENEQQRFEGLRVEKQYESRKTEQEQLVAEKIKKIKIAVAMDEAFCFYYRDNLRMLENAGAKIVPFSPLHDEKLPVDINGILLGGGYPELVAEKLSQNKSMRDSIKKAIENGIPSLAECGGFMYLHDSITDKEGHKFEMVGAVPGDCHDTGKLVRFGYAEFSDAKNELHIKGHEFHYFDSDNCGDDFYAQKPLTGKNWRCMHYSDNHLWGYGHLFYPSEPKLVQWFIEKCQEYHRRSN